jgi:two-component system cell cycle sensor histidine kinase/response regulator CckA
MKSAILLVDDCESLRSVLARYLTLHGYSVIQAHTDLEALRTCDEFEGGIPLLITDISLPEMSGIELAERVTAIRPEASVLYISGYAPDTGMESWRESFLQKPFRLDDLVERVRSIIGEPNGLRIPMRRQEPLGIPVAW